MVVTHNGPAIGIVTEYATQPVSLQFQQRLILQRLLGIQTDITHALIVHVINRVIQRRRPIAGKPEMHRPLWHQYPRTGFCADMLMVTGNSDIHQHAVDKTAGIKPLTPLIVMVVVATRIDQVTGMHHDLCTWRSAVGFTHDP